MKYDVALIDFSLQCTLVSGKGKLAELFLMYYYSINTITVAAEII